jgi:glycolate dehydrogenase FAD-binding subunit
MATVARAMPATFAQAAATLAAASAEGHTVAFRGAGTKAGWGRPAAEADLELRTAGLSRIVEHNAGDLTAILEAGVPLAEAQKTFAAAGQMLALDPPLFSIGGAGAGNGSGSGDAGPSAQPATIGGIAATGDSGPLRHRYGGPRDLIVGATVALSDGTIAHSGGKVIKNVAGYDLAKLFAGSFGTLGLILSVSVRLHPRLDTNATVLGAATDHDVLGRAAVALSQSRLEFEALDVAWRAGRGGILARCNGREYARRAQRAARHCAELGLTGVEVTEDDETLWERQRAGQRAREGALVRISAPPSALSDVLRATDACQGTLVGRAALGISYVALAPEGFGQLRSSLAAARSLVVLDAPEALRSQEDPWGPLPAANQELMRSVKVRFDPTGTCNPGLFVGGI